MRAFVAALTPAFVLAQAAAPAAEPANRPVSKVIKLLNEMRTSLASEQKTDAELYEKMECWCKQNRGQKTAAVEAAQNKIANLEAAIEGYTARAAQLETEIKQLNTDIAKNQDALSEATALREKENAAFLEEKKELEETIDALTRAVGALGKAHGSNGETVGTAFLQLKQTLKRGNFADEMRKDLWDVLGSYGSDESAVNTADMFLAPKALMQQPTGAAAGAVSYNSQSGAIFGVLQQMEEDFKKKLSNAIASENAAENTFQAMKNALLKEIAAQNASVKSKKSELADTVQKNAQAKKDVEDTKNALSADEQFLVELEKKCSQSDEEYQQRQKTRSEEITAVGEAIGVLTNDESRDLFSRTFNSFVQVKINSKSTAILRAKAAKKILSAAKKQGNFQLAALAVSVKLDGFGKVKKAMDDMLAELKRQQKNEFEHRDFCIAELDKNEDETSDKNKFLADTQSSIEDLSGQIDSLKKQVEVLSVEIADSQTSIKRAGEDRAAENKEFQTTVADQRLTVNILNKALDKLAAFYEPKEKVVSALQQPENKPGRAMNDKAAPKQAEYSQQGAAPGVMGLIQMIIQDAEAMAKECTFDEQKAQASYENFVVDSNKSIAAAQTQIENNNVSIAKAETERSQHRDAENDTVTILKTLANENAALHTQCDFTLKNFEITQQARQEEMESIEQAKAVLSGADFA